MSTIEQDFVTAVDSLELPDPDLVAAVMAQLAAPAPSPARRPRFGLVAAAIVIVLVGLVAVPPARSAVLDWLGVGSTQIEVRPDSAESTISENTNDSFADLGAPAPTGIGGALLSSLGSPVRVFDHPVRGRSFIWSARDDLPPLGDSEIGVILTLRAIDASPLVKSVAAGTGADPVVIAHPSGPLEAYWIGGEHELQISGPTAAYRAQRVLLWVDADVEYRLESNADLDVVLSLAATVEGGRDLLPAQ